MNDQKTTVIRKKEIYDLDEVNSFRDLLRFVDRKLLQATIEKEEVWTWAEVETALNWLLALPTTPSDSLIVVTQVEKPIIGETLDCHICPMEGLANTDTWVELYSQTPRGYIDAKVISLRVVSLYHHQMVAKMLYAIMPHMDPSPTPHK